jgi:hypothetical protein
MTKTGKNEANPMTAPSLATFCATPVAQIQSGVEIMK